MVVRKVGLLMVGLQYLQQGDGIQKADWTQSKLTLGRFISSSWLIISSTSFFLSFHTTWASYVEQNSLDWNENELELEDLLLL